MLIKKTRNITYMTKAFLSPTGTAHTRTSVVPAAPGAIFEIVDTIIAKLARVGKDMALSTTKGVLP